jgi:hypothetical protein
MEFNLLNLDNRGKCRGKIKSSEIKRDSDSSSNFTHENKKQISGAIRWIEHKEGRIDSLTNSAGEQKQRVKRNLKIK